MKSCLPDRSLLALYYGEGSASHLAHLETCFDCAARHQQLVRDLKLIRHTLERIRTGTTVRAMGDAIDLKLFK